MKILKSIIIILLAVLVSSCTTSKYTRGEQYPKFYEEQPTTLLVMPPINNTTDVEAKDLLYTSISRPLAEAGYYVISPHLAMDIFKSESAYDAELFLDNGVSEFGKVFGADAVVFSVINKWKKVGVGIETDIRYVVKSTRTNEILFDRSCDLFLDLSVGNYGNNSLVAQLASLTATLINTAITEKIVAARRCNYYILRDIPRGKYNPLYLQDQDVKAEKKDVQAVVRELVY